MGERFVGWQRSQIFRLAAPGVINGGRLQAALPVSLEDLADPADSRGGATPFELFGPGDVANLVPAAITARIPNPGQQDALETKAVQVELAAADLPWRYTPAVAGVSQGLRPWLVLVVGSPGSEIVLRRDGTVELRSGALRAHRLSESHRWAHVHDLGSRKIARLLSPRDLVENSGYVAVLVPAFTARGDDPAPTLADAWDDVVPSVVLPCYDWWAFRTGPPLDFADLATRLAPKSVADIPTFAVASVRYDPLDRAQPVIELPVSAALMRVPAPGESAVDAGAIDPAIATEVRGLVTTERTYEGRWVLAMPRYDEPWPGADSTGWRDELASDPRRRGVAGLGAWAGIAWQQHIAETAAAQAGALAIAAQRIRHLTLGLAASRSLWNRRLPPKSDPVARLTVLAPLLGRLPTGDGSVLEGIDGRTPRLSAALFSSAAARVLRGGPARSALAAPGAGRLASVLNAVNRCPAAYVPDDLERRLHEHGRGEPDPHAFAAIVADARRRAGDRRDTLDALLARLPDWLREGYRPATPALLAALDPGGNAPPDLSAVRAEVDRLERTELPPPDDAFLGGLDVVRHTRETDPPCRPVDLDALGRRVADAVDPTVGRPLVVERVLGGITGLKEPRLAPPELSPELDLPLWKFLDESARDWLLPGVGDLPLHSVVAVQTNPVFADAFLAGANHQTLGELRWRNIPIETGWTPLRRFWQRIAFAAGPEGGHAATDIRPILSWPAGSTLGAVSHQEDPADGTQLVVVFHTELFRRFPATVVYLTPADKDGLGNPVWSSTPDTDVATVPRVHPTMTGSVGPDVVFFGFPLAPIAGRDHWVVLEEPPPGYRFYTKNQTADTCEDAARAAEKDTAADGATYAHATYALPVRVFLGQLLPP